MREHAAFVTSLIADLNDLVDRCESVLFGREVGANFWRRFDANIAGLERVVERDRWYAEALEEVAANDRAWRSGAEPCDPPEALIP